MANPLHVAIKQAEKDNRTLRMLFGRYIGMVEHPRGRILSAYRSARLAMRQALRTGNRGQVEGVLMALRFALADVGTLAIGEAIERGRESARAQIATYFAAGIPTEARGETPDIGALHAGWMAEYYRQAQMVSVTMVTGGDVGLIVGDERRLGILQPASMAREAAYWLAMALAAGITTWVIGRDREPGRVRWGKQTIAAIDERTTDCCLRAHGQIVPLDKKFRLTGTPRYADKLDWTPFHWWCRSSVALYLPEFEDGITQEMVGAAQAEITAREETGERVEIHPAHARSRR